MSNIYAFLTTVFLRLIISSLSDKGSYLNYFNLIVLKLQAFKVYPDLNSSSVEDPKPDPPPI